MNLYGYGAGDPINNSDPFGLAPCPPDDDCTALMAAMTITGAALGAFLGGGGGAIAGLACGPGAPACSTAAGSAGAAQGAAWGASAGLALGVLFSKSQADAVATAESQVDHVNSHIGKLQDDPNNSSANGWRREINAGIQKVERQLKHMGKKTAEKWKQVVDEWKSATPPEGTR
jgi:hypothetical protein